MFVGHSDIRTLLDDIGSIQPAEVLICPQTLENNPTIKNILCDYPLTIASQVKNTHFFIFLQSFIQFTTNGFVYFFIYFCFLKYADKPTQKKNKTNKT